MLDLQRQVGNAAVTTFLSRQPTLPVAAPPDQPTLADQAPELLRPVFVEGLSDVAEAGLSAADFEATLAEAAVKAVPRLSTTDTEMFRTRVKDIAGLEDNGYTIATALPALAKLHEKASGGTDLGIDLSLGVKELVNVLAVHGGKFLAAGLVPTGQTPMPADMLLQWQLGDVTQDLAVAVRALNEPKQLMRIELEGTIAELVRERAAFAAGNTQDERAPHGQQIGDLARRVLLLDKGLQAIPDPTPGAAPPQSALEQQLLGVAGQIAALRQTARDEVKTRSDLGDRPELLGVHQVAIPEPQLLPDDATQPVMPEEAFPETVDAATTQFITDLDRRVRDQTAETKRLHDLVMPPSPTYSLQEFSEIFRRWYAFFSHAQEAMDPTFQLWSKLVGIVQEQAGMDVGGTTMAISGGIGRAFFMDQAVQGLSEHMGVASTQFTGEVKQAREHREAPDVGGRASAPDYRYAELFTDPTRAQSIDAAGEQRSRAELARRREGETATSFSTVAQMPPYLQPLAAKQTGIAGDPPVPIVGLRTTTATEGWSYLIDVYSEGPDPMLVEREHKVMSDQTAQYLLARRQQLGTLETTHRPMVGGIPIGDPGTRLAGVEGAAATSTARYKRGELAPRDSDAARSLAATLDRARRESGARGPTKATAKDHIEDAALGLIAEYEAYLDKFFQFHPEVAFRLGAILVIGDVEWGVGTQLMSLLDPDTIAEMVEQAMAISLAMAALEALGPLGELAAIGFQAYLGSHCVSNVAALITIAGFFRNASQADSLDKARAWGLMMPYIVGDASQLFQTLVTLPVTHAMSEALKERPRTPTELAEVCRPMMEDPAARDALIHAVDGRIAELHEHGAGRDHDDPELDALEAFAEQLNASAARQSVMPSDPGKASMDLPGRQTERTKAEEFFAGGHIRTGDERAALKVALGEVADRVTIVENPTLSSTTVRVHYDGDRMFMEVGPEAKPEHISAHVETAKELLRYEGVLGRILRLVSRIQSWLRVQPGYGTQGFEAKLEVKKLRGMIEGLEAQKAAIEDRAHRYAGDPEAAKSGAESESITREIEFLEQQLAEHERNVDSFEQGVGFVAAAGRTPDPRDPGLQAAADRVRAGGAMREALARDVNDDLADRVRTESNRLFVELAQGHIDEASAQRALNALGRAAGEPDLARAEAQIHNALSELSNAVRVVRSGEVAAGEKVRIGIKPDEARALGVELDPHLTEADALYKGADGDWHVDEVKGTAHALLDKLLKDSDQLERLQKWRDADRGRAAEIVIGSDSGWTDVFSRTTARGRAMAIEVVIDSGLPIRIGDERFTTDRLRALRGAIEADMAAAGAGSPADVAAGRATMTYRDYFERVIPTLAATRARLGANYP